MSADFINIFNEITTAYHSGSQLPKTGEVVNALLAAEKAAKKERLNYSFESLLGTWKLCFATGTKKVQESGSIKLGRGFYIPKFINIGISFSADDFEKGNVGNQVKLGMISLKLTGPAKYPGKKNILAFDFTQMNISLFDRLIYKQNIRSGQDTAENFYNQSIAKQAFFAFFLVTENLIAARGRGGGLAIWVRENS